jgi:hypothetical protein
VVKRKDLPMWLLQSNFLCLLNLSDTVREFGSLCNYFEGKYLGELFVQEVKDARQHCLHQNVTTNLLKKLHQGKALEAMASNQSAKVNVYKPTGRFNTKKASLKENICVYCDRQQANLSFHSQKSISALETTKGVFGVLFYENGSNRWQIKMMQLERHNNTVTVGNGLRYWK